MVVITAISIDVCACVITTATSIKAPCISQWRSSPPASSSSLGESFPEESLQGCRLPRKQEVPFWLLGTDPPPQLGRPLRVTTVPSGFGFPGTGRLRPPPAWTAQLPGSGAQPQGSLLSIEDHGKTELGVRRAQRWAGLLTPVGGWVGARGLVPCVLFQRLSWKAHHCPGKAWEIRTQMTHLWGKKDNFRAAWVLITKSRDAFQRLLKKS